MSMHVITRSGLFAFLKIEGRLFEKSLLLLQWLSWALSFEWLRDRYLEKSLSEIVKKYGIKKIGCTHEMHSYARIVWRVAAEYNAMGYTVQHAALTRGKRWYFCYPEEKRGGLKLPDVMYIYNRKVVDTLKPFYENTRFLLGCSGRYAHWKDVKRSDSKGKYYLFVGALAGFANEVLIASLRTLLKNAKESMPIRLRLHPFAKLGYNQKHWMQSLVKKGIIEISKDISLKTDIEDAIAVIGMSTTVLEEALLLGRPVIQICHPDYLQFIEIDGIQGATKKDYRELFPRDLLEASNLSVDCEMIRNKLGLGHSVVTYKQLFS